MQRSCLLVALSAAALLLGVFAAPLFAGEVHTFNDLGLFHLPVRAFYASCLAEGHSFLWWPNQYTGVYLHGEGQGGFTHPLQWLGYRLLPLPTAFELELLRSPVFAFAGTAILLRRRGLDGGAAGLGALLVAFSGFATLHYLHPNLVGVWAHVPWLLLCIDLAIGGERPAVRALGNGGLVLLTASQLLLGHPQGVWLSLLVALPWALFTARRTRRGVACLLPPAAAALLGLGVASVQVMPTLETAARSARGVGSTAFSATPALAPLDLVQLLAPYLFQHRVAGGIPWECAAWPGAVCLVLTAWLLLRGRALSGPRPLALFGLGLAGAGLWLALGDAGGLYRLQRALPLFGWLRAPARHVALAQLGLALAAAVALHDLLRLPAPLPWRRLWPLAVPAVAAVAVTGALLAFPPGPEPGLVSSPLRVAAGPLLLAAAAGLVAAGARGHALALPVLVALAALDLGTYGLSFVRSHPARPLERFVAQLPVPPGDGGQRLLAGNWALTLRGVRFALGYLALRPERALSFHSPGGDPREARRLQAALRIAGVGHAFGGPVPRPLPRARFVTRARASADPGRDLAGIDVEREALVPRQLALEPGEPGEASIVEEHPGEIALRAEVPGRQLLVLSESFHPGWRAEVDGEPCEVLPVYGDFMGCAVEAGAHEIRFRFEPRLFAVARWVSLLCGAVALLWCVGSAARGHPPSPPGAASA